MSRRELKREVDLITAYLILWSLELKKCAKWLSELERRDPEKAREIVEKIKL